MNALEVTKLSKKFRHDFISKPKLVLNNVSFGVPEKKITGFLGGNGAGKTTSLNCIFDFIKRDSGQIHFFGNNTLSNTIKKRIGYLPERNFSFDTLTAYEFICFAFELSTGKSFKTELQRIEMSFNYMGLEPFKHQRLRTYSKGMLQKVGLIQSMIHNPDLIILDEPMSGLDPDGRYIVSQQIERANKNGASVFFSSHILSDVDKLCTHLVILKEGQVLFQGPKEDLYKDADVGILVEWTHKETKQDATTTAKSLIEANKIMYDLISQGHMVKTFASQRMSLEDIFIRLALKKRSE